MNCIKIIIADDNIKFCDILSKALSKNPNFEIIGTARDGIQALKLLSENTPDILILDLIMPNSDGLEVLEQLPSLNLSKRPKVIVSSSISQEHITQRAFALGADYYIVKPFDLKIFQKRIIQLHNANYLPSNKNSSNPLYNDVINILNTLGIPAHVKGYAYLNDAILMAISDVQLLNAVTKQLYPSIAQKYTTSSSGVERAIRNAIEIAWNKGLLKKNTSDLNFIVKPTNSELIASIINQMKLNQL